MTNFFGRYFEVFLMLALLAAAAIQYFLFQPAQSLHEIRQTGVLRVLISDEPDSQFELNQQHFGFEYELLAAYADENNFQIALQVVPFAELFSRLDAGAGDIAIGGILLNDYVQRVSTPTIPWYQAQTTITYRRGTERPLTIAELNGEPVLASARYYGLKGFEKINLQDDHRSEYELLSAVANGDERYVLSTNYRAKKARHYLPELNRSFILDDKVDLVWVLPKKHDVDLLAHLDDFLETSVKQRLPEQLADHYLALPKRLSTFDALTMHRKISQLLPEFEYEFRRAARRGGIDWTLLAAVAYQESRWSNAARSPTGVRGIMQLTTRTAKQLGVTDRLDMSQSIQAAARYLKLLKDRLPKHIAEPDRTWFAVGAYNVGLKHVLYARRRARDEGLAYNKWASIAPLLPELYNKPFAQGQQAKDYVERVRMFADILRFYDLHQRDKVRLKPLAETG